MTQQLDVFGEPLAGGQLFIMQAGTVATPQNPYQDAALTLAMPNPIPLNAAGRIPQFFLADGYIKIRLADVNGVTQLAADNILVIGPSAGGGGGTAVDPTTIQQTGDVKVRYDTARLAGYVRLNGLGIGSSTSGAGELADPSAQALFNYLWNKDPNLGVSPSRGASSAADWAANKIIYLPDFRGCAISGLDDMGAAPAGRLTSSYFGSGTVLGAFGGFEQNTLTAQQMPAHYHTANIYDPGHSHPFSATQGGTLVNLQGGGTYTNAYLGGPASAGNTNAAVTSVRVNSPNGFDTTGSVGGGQPFRTIGPRRLLTIYMKL